jgi:hypothetical protein
MARSAPLADQMASPEKASVATLYFAVSVAPCWTREDPMSVRALAKVAAGHAEHHLGILRERYVEVPR